MSSFSQEEKIAALRLSRTRRVGPVTFRQLVRRYGSPSEAIRVLPDLARKGGSSKPLTPPAAKEIESEIKALRKMGGDFLVLGEPDYPEALAAIEDAPPVLSYIGHKNLLHKKTIGIVGARNASLNGRKMTERLARDLGSHDYVVASGMARGIDTAAHQSALETGTIAVLAGGVDVVYPEENHDLYKRITETGLVVSDQPLGLEPFAKLFPRRNRIISGLSQGVIVVEAAKKSGSLITARMALEQGRDVFAVPGSPLDPRARGPNDLIRQGAVITEKIEDVLEHQSSSLFQLCETSSPTSETPIPPVSERDIETSREKILENLSTCAVSVDELARSCQLSLPVVLTVLLELELAGKLERQAGHKIARIG